MFNLINIGCVCALNFALTTVLTRSIVQLVSVILAVGK